MAAQQTLPQEKAKLTGSLSVTALYTSYAYAWGGLSRADLFASKDAKAVFDVTNAAVSLGGLFRRDFPSLRCGVVHRHTMIDRLARASGAKQVLELAAGLSRRGAALTDDSHVKYTELDLPLVVAKKRELLARTEEGRAVLARPNLVLAEADVEKEDLARWVTPGEPLFVIAEGLFLYLAPESQRALWRRVHQLAVLAPEVYFAFDLIPWSEQPKPGMVGRTLEAAFKQFTGGQTLAQEERSRHDVQRELRAAGFGDVACFDPCAVAREWELPFPETRTQQLVFVARATSSPPCSPAAPTPRTARE